MAEYYKDLVPGSRVSCKYNEWVTIREKNPYGGAPFETSHLHQGIDFAQNLGTPIPAAADGTVFGFENEYGGYGHYVILQHKDRNGKDVYTIYAQMRGATPLAKGQTVKKSQTVGYVGETGNATGPHVHFEIRLDKFNGTTIDPATYDLSQLQPVANTTQSSSTEDTNQQASSNQPTNTNGQANTTTDAAQNDSRVNRHATPTACTEDQFIVQIMGQDHPEGQRVILVDDKNNIIEADSQDTIASSEQTLLSTLHQWDWCNLQDKKDKLKAYLEIKTSGNPIRILISEQIEQTEKQLDKQHNQIVPVVPTTLVRRVADFNYDTSYTEFITNLGVPVVARPGYLYIYKNDLLVRELQIIAKDKDTIAFKDIPIEQYRQANIFVEGKREATGVELAEIWIPSCWNEKNTQNTSFMYSEVQLSGDRLNYLAINKAEFEKHPKTTPATLAVEKITHRLYEKDILMGHELLANFSNQRINARAARLTGNSSKAISTINLFKKQIIATNLISPHRMRDTLQEITLDNPAKYLYDQDETFFETAMQLARRFEDDNQTGKAQFYSLSGNYYQVNREIRDLEFSAWAQEVEARKQFITKAADVLFSLPRAVISLFDKERPVVATTQASEEGTQTATFSIFDSIKSPINGLLQDIVNIVSTDGEPEKPTTPPNMWKNALAFKNVLQDAQDREIYSVYVDDIIYSNRHLVTNINNTAQQLRTVVDQAARQSYFDSALIIQQIVAPEKLGDKPNELRETLRKKLDQEGKRKLAVACSATGRAALVTKYSELQGKLCAQFQSPELLETLADHLSQDNQVHYTAAYINALRSILSFALPTQQIDPYLSPDGRVYYGIQKIGEAINQQQGLEFLATLIESLDSQLHKMLFKPVDLEAASRSLTDADKNKPTPNFGNGYIRPNILHKCLTDKKEPTKEDTENLDSALLVLEFAKTEDDTIKRAVNFGKDLAGAAASAFNNIESLVKHWKAQEKIEIDNNKTIRSSIQVIDDELERLRQQKQAIDAERQRIASEKTASIYNETIAIAEETSKQAEQLIRENEQQRAELERKLPPAQADADKAREIQNLEQQQQQHQQQIAATNKELIALQEHDRALRQANADQQTIAQNQQQIANKQAELARLKAQTPSQTASNTGNAHINDALANNRNNGQARVGTVNLHELPMSLWRLVMFDHTRHVLGGLIAQAYIAPFERRIQGPGSNVKGILIRFPETPEAKTLLRELYGDMVNADYEIEASTNRDRVGRRNNTNSPQRFLAIFAPEGSDLHKFLQALEEEALAGRAEEFVQANTAKRIQIAEGYRNRAQADLDARQGREQALQAEIEALEGQNKTLQNNVDKTIAEHGQLQEQGATAQQLAAKAEEIKRQQQLQTENQNRITQLTADLGLEGAYQKGLVALIDYEQATINQLQEAEKRGGTLQETKDQADQTVSTEQDRILQERNKGLAQAQADVDTQIAQHSADYDKIQQQKPQYDILQENLASSEKAIAGARTAVATNTRNLARLDWLVDNNFFRGSVLAFQGYNLYKAFDSWEQMMQERGGLYAWSTLGSAAGNVALALEDIIAHSTRESLKNLRGYSSAFRNKVWFEIPRSKVPNFLANSSKVVLNLKVTTMVICQTVLSVVAIGLTGADLWQSICKNEKGIITFAKGLAFLGSLVGLASIFIGGATFLLLNPLGWVALLLTLAAFALIWVFSKTPLEAWLQYGPFSASPKPYLVNETEAFYRLVGIYADVQITIDNNPNVRSTDIQNKEDVKLNYKNKQMTFTKVKLGQRIRITSQLGGLMATGKDTIAYNNQFSLKAKSGFIDEEFNKMLQLNLNMIENDLPNGKEYLLDKVDHLKLYTQNAAGRGVWYDTVSSKWLVDSQILVKYNSKVLAFPALRANNDEDLNYTQATTKEYMAANFKRDFIGETHRPFWANETSHLAKPGTTAAAPQKTEQASVDDIILSNNATKPA